MGLLVEMVLLELRVTVVTLARLVLLVLQVHLVLQAQLVPLENRETEGRLALKDLLDLPGPLEQEECLDLKALAVTRVKLEKVEKEDRRDTEASLVCRVFPDLQVKLETRVPQDLLDLQDKEDHLDLLAHLEKMVQMVSQDLLVLLDLVDALETPVLLDLQETLVPLAPPAPLALALTCLPLLVWVRLTRVLILSDT